MTQDVAAAVRAALQSVYDPEYPGISVIDMGMIGSVTVDDGTARVELIPTFSGCPALGVITADITAAASTVDGITDVSVERSSLPWSTDRLTEHARATLASDFTVAVALPTHPPVCPRCGEHSLTQQSPFGPSRCRAIHLCHSCHETIEVLRA